jgi:hypothetical protein
MGLERTFRMAKKMEVRGTEIRILTVEQGDYISLTDMLKAKDGDFFISDWLRNRNTVEFLGIWERVYNPHFNYGEFAIIKSQAGLNSYKLSVKEWRDSHPDRKGNIRDYANVSQLVCLSNLENLNALFIQENIPQAKRLRTLNQIAIQQMKLLTDDTRIKQLEAGDK